MASIKSLLIFGFKVLFFIRRKLTFDNPINQLIAYTYLRAHGVDCEYGAIRLQGFPIIRKAPGSSIKITGRVHLISKAEYNVAGVNHRCIISTVSKNASIRIKGPFGASGCAIVASKSINIDKNVTLGVNTKIYDTDFHPIDPIYRSSPEYSDKVKSGPVEIGENVWICANSTVLKNVRIGQNAVVGAHSLVLKSIPENVVFGNEPAHFIYDLKKVIPQTVLT